MHKHSYLTLTALLFSSYTTADVYVQPKIGLEYINYELKVGDSSPATATIPALALGASFIHSSNWYLDVNLSFGQGEVSDFYPEDDYIDHGALTLSVGKSIDNNYAIYGGFNNSSRLIRNKKDQLNQGDSAEFNSEGVFLGIAKTLPIDKKHLFNITAAIGSMEGTYRLHLANGGYTAKGNAIGYSGSTAYTYRASESTSLTTGIKVQSYEYSNMSDEYNAGTTFDNTTESIINLFAKISHTF